MSARARVYSSLHRLWTISESARVFFACEHYISRTTRNFFFFQAEDGIRDYKVTGVQTCALPIYAKDKEKIAAGLKKAFEMHVDPKNDKSETYLDRLKASKWPAGKLEDLKKEPKKDRKSVV